MVYDDIHLHILSMFISFTNIVHIVKDAKSDLELPFSNNAESFDRNFSILFIKTDVIRSLKTEIKFYLFLILPKRIFSWSTINNCILCERS